ncbi:glycoside hydrolase family 17 protein [Hebeloma cylindrosporum]|uniref:glucan endo-1,3-beta-D-glucosidase n=1 Tax=Hebeloma cylindrosporum TaxID=76867 RepID=A0A0C3C4R6_HEBCY|nr:glycoside hydrolase family 17 protein [Hebeloma cylindrosporum h7]
MPGSVPSSLTNWWCNTNTEYAFMGFSYEVTDCQSAAQLKKDFKDIRHTFNGRYVRLYGACDRQGFYNDVVEAAWEASVGVHALIWFGWDDPNIWKTRRDALFSILLSNAKAKYVTRVVQFGSEPLYDNAIAVAELTAQIKEAKAKLASLHIPVTISEMAYGYQRESEGSTGVMAAIDFIDAHMLPFFSQKASTAKESWPLVESDLNWFVSNGLGKKIYLSQNGWPSTTYPGVEPNSAKAVANVQNEHDYYTLLNDKCSYFKGVAGGGVGWFAHIYSDSQEPGYGIYDDNGNLKFSFSPKTSC